jgi:uncharacterized protein
MRTSPSSEHPRHADLWKRVQKETGCTDLAHDHLHVLRVYDWAMRLAPEARADADLTGAAALVHDLVNIPKEHRDRPLGSEKSAEASRGLLEDVGYTPEEVAQVVEAVRTCSWSRGLPPTNAIGIALQDADRLDAIGSLGIARTFATAQAMSSRGQNSRFYDPEDPRAHTNRTLNDRRQPVDHFYAKLLKLSATMHTQTAQVEGAKRHARMERFLNDLMEEIDSE